MKQTLKKLNSRAGSTMIIALMFMLICVFVGGSVLVSATVNSGRLSGLRRDSQAVLNQRSIASVFVNKLKEGKNGELGLKVDLYTDDAGVKTIPTLEGYTGLEYIIFSSAQKKLSGAENTKVSFTVTDSRGGVTQCYAQCEDGYVVYIRFEDDPQVRLQLSGYSTDSYIAWTKAKVVKEVLAE